MTPWHLYSMAAMYIGIGCMHFVKPKAFMSVMPRFIPAAKIMVYLSGLAEIILGILICFQPTKVLALWGIIVMLTVFLIVHVYMITDAKFHQKFPKPLLWFRLFLQFGLMYWAYFYI